MTSPADRSARIRSLVGAFNRHDVTGIVAHLADSMIWTRGDGTALRGKDDVAACLEDFFAAFPDASLVPAHVLPMEPNALVLEWVLEGTNLGDWRLPDRREPIPPSGRAVRVIGADLFVFNPADEIASDEARIDVATLLIQISAPPGRSPEPVQLRELASRYTAAWGSQDAASVAAFYKRVRLSGFEVWQIGVDGLIAESRGHFDTAVYQRQIEHGVTACE